MRELEIKKVDDKDEVMRERESQMDRVEGAFDVMVFHYISLSTNLLIPWKEEEIVVK